jgi:hypothetical protein
VASRHTQGICLKNDAFPGCCLSGYRDVLVCDTETSLQSDDAWKGLLKNDISGEMTNGLTSYIKDNGSGTRVSRHGPSETSLNGAFVGWIIVLQCSDFQNLASTSANSVLPKAIRARECQTPRTEFPNPSKDNGSIRLHDICAPPVGFQRAEIVYWVRGRCSRAQVGGR